MKIGVIGAWHLGTVTAACLADLGYDVTAADREDARIQELNAGTSPIFEPGLGELLARNLAAGRLRFTTDLGQAVTEAPYVIIAYDTPVDDQDRVDLAPLISAAAEIAPHLSPAATVIVSSQVPVGTCAALADIIQEANPSPAFGIACVPENLRLGQAIELFKAPDFLVLGADEGATHERLEALFAPIKTAKLRMGLRTAEMTKHAINAYLATSISFINEIANLCDIAGADAPQVSEALRLDRRIGPGLPLKPGLGFAGGTLARDMKALQRLAAENKCEAPLIKAVLAVNERQNRLVIERLKEYYGTLRGLHVGVLGLTYKPGTSTLRRSAALELIQELAAQGASVKAYDPKADPRELEGWRDLFTLSSDPYGAAEGSQALILATGWPQFKELDFTRIRGLVENPLILDAQNLLDADRMSGLGFIYRGIGRSRGP